MKTFFADRNVTLSSVRAVNEFPVKGLAAAGGVTKEWVAETPATDYFTIGRAIAELENERVLVSVKAIQIRALDADPASQAVSLTVRTLLTR
jgi:hypothetical protein